jgi:chromosome segregation ATPase
MTRLEKAMREMKAKEERLSTMTSATADYEVVIKRKEASIADLIAEAGTYRSDIEDLTRKLRAADSTAEIAKRDVQAMTKDSEKLNGNMSRLQSELDGLRRLMSAKQDEAAQWREADRSRETELTGLRDQLTQSGRDAKSMRDSLNQSIETLGLQLKEAKTDLATTTVESDNFKSQLAEAQGQLERQTNLLSSTAKVTRGLESDLAECRKRLIVRDAELDAANKAKEVSNMLEGRNALKSDRLFLLSRLLNGT